MWNRTRTVRIGLAFTRELMEPLHTELLTRQGEIRLRIADDNWKICSRRALCGKFFSRIFHVPDKWREAVVWNCSCLDALKGTVLHRMVPRDRVNGKAIHAYAEQFQSPV